MKQLPTKLPISVALLTCIVCALGFSLIALWVSDHQVRHFDHKIITAIGQLESPAMTRLMKCFTMIGSGIPVVIIILIAMFVLYSVLGHRRELFFLAVAVLGSVLLNMVLKMLFQRARPEINRIIEANGYSFPSGHSMTAFSMYAALTFLLWKHVPSRRGRILLVVLSSLLILTIGASRIYLGVHYPSDVVGGYFMSGCWMAACIWFYQRYEERMLSLRTKSTA
ncbi:phosphatase PAP2 family protein [Paenibacillus polymyxa]|uniref:phosphatase PAP2 family protein n=1 Tax=Paenibacillus polymyxa TaxID=1406 RepID=UPI000471E29F|nr:phosphatase PAP2 family protein [Paenibacillus polymyxa]AJE49696.1 phospholipid phosphatase [Paenibacillus polymyxa]QOH61927.1 phosphatase PAP2 family protein [Paenibacillus polymyxa]